MRKPTFWFSTKSDTNQAVQLQNMARGLKFRIYKVEGLYYVAKTKALISFVVTAKLICVFVFAYIYANVCFLMTRLILFQLRLLRHNDTQLNSVFVVRSGKIGSLTTRLICFRL